MSGYRDNSGFDPYAYERPGRPLRPYNWVQWIGVAFIVTGATVSILLLLGDTGVVPGLRGTSPQPFVTFPLIGMLLVNSRREPGTPVDELQRQRNRRVLLITIAICAAILGAAAVIAFKGA